MSGLYSLNFPEGGRTFFLASNSPLTKYAQMYELLAETADMKAKYVEVHNCYAVPILNNVDTIVKYVCVDTILYVSILFGAM